MTSDPELQTAKERLEEWRDVVGHAGYRVSSLGRMTGHQGIMHPSLDHARGGYLKVALHPRPVKNRYVHWLVAAAFLGPRPEGHEVAHLNGDPTDNQLSNLAYVTPKVNGEQRIAHGRQIRGQDHGHAKLTPEIVAAIRAHPGSSSVVAREHGIHPGHVRKLRNGGAWSWMT